MSRRRTWSANLCISGPGCCDLAWISSICTSCSIPPFSGSMLVTSIGLYRECVASFTSLLFIYLQRGGGGSGGGGGGGGVCARVCVCVGGSEYDGNGGGGGVCV